MEFRWHAGFHFVMINLWTERSVLKCWNFFAKASCQMKRVSSQQVAQSRDHCFYSSLRFLLPRSHNKHQVLDWRQYLVYSWKPCLQVSPAFVCCSSSCVRLKSSTLTTVNTVWGQSITNCFSSSADAILDSIFQLCLHYTELLFIPLFLWIHLPHLKTALQLYRL